MPYTNYIICLGKNKGNRILLLVCLNLSLSSFSFATRRFGNELFFFGRCIVDKNEVGTTLGIGPLQQKCKYCSMKCVEISLLSSHKREL